MSRSGYTDDCDGSELGLWRGAVARATYGQRGQSFLRELRSALDAMPNKELIVNTFKDDTGCFCTLGVIAAERGMDFGRFPADPDDIDAGTVAKELGIARALAAETMFMNDEGSWRDTETPAERWTRMRKWVESNITPTGAEEVTP